jgi:hypothetical protein
MGSGQGASTPRHSALWPQEFCSIKRYHDASFIQGRLTAPEYEGRGLLDLFLEDTTGPRVPELLKPSTTIKDFCQVIDWQTLEVDLSKQDSPSCWLHEQVIDPSNISEEVDHSCHPRLTASGLFRYLSSKVSMLYRRVTDFVVPEFDFNLAEA